MTQRHKPPKIPVKATRRARSRSRSEQTKKLEKQWEHGLANRQAAIDHNYGREIETFDGYGKPIGKGQVSERDVAWEDVALGLDRAFEATGDPIFSDALNVLREYGLDGGKPKASLKRAREAVFGPDRMGPLELMRWIVQHEDTSTRHAAEIVAARCLIGGPTFNAVTKSLRDDYASWQTAGFPKFREIQGSSGYQVKVRPAPGRRIVYFDQNQSPVVLSAEGAVVEWTRYWRRRFADGDVEASRI